MSHAAGAATYWVDGRPAGVEVLAAAQVNYGHFTTLQVCAGAVQGLSLHLQRLQGANLELFGSPLEEERIRHGLAAALAAARVGDASARIAAFAPDMAPVDRGDAAPVALLVTLSPPRAMPTAALRAASRVHVRPLPHLKHAAILPLLHARRSARCAGFDDALLVDAAGHIAEGSVWNIGFVERGGIVWPQAAALEGVTLRMLRAALDTAGIAQRQAPLRVADCAGFDAAFACNSSGIRPVASIDALRLGGDAGMQRTLRALLQAQPWEPVSPG